MGKRRVAINNFFEKINFPSDAAQRLSENMPPETLSPFVPVKTAEKSLAYKMALAEKLEFEFTDSYLRGNAKNEKSALRASVVSEYDRLQADGFFPSDFSPEEAAKRLEGSITGAISSMQDRLEANGNPGSQSNKGGKHTR